MKIFHRNVSEFMPKLRRGSLLQMHIDEYFFKDESDLIESNKPIYGNVPTNFNWYQWH
jgi:hypothetical protein